MPGPPLRKTSFFAHYFLKEVVWKFKYNGSFFMQTIALDVFMAMAGNHVS